MSDNDILYRHLRDDKNVPYATLAMIYKGQTAYIGASLCNKSDNFSYARGREIANYRLNALLNGKTPQQLVAVYKDIKTFDQAENILHNIYVAPYHNVKTGLNYYKLSTLMETHE